MRMVVGDGFVFDLRHCPRLSTPRKQPRAENTSESGAAHSVIPKQVSSETVGSQLKSALELWPWYRVGFGSLAFWACKSVRFKVEACLGIMDFLQCWLWILGFSVPVLSALSKSLSLVSLNVQRVIVGI